MRDLIFNHHNAVGFLNRGSYHEEENCINGLIAVLKIAECIKKYHASSVEKEGWCRIAPAVLEYLNLSDTDFNGIYQDKFEKLETEFNYSVPGESQ